MISFLLRMTDTVTSQNIDLSSWDTLYYEMNTSRPRTISIKCLMRNCTILVAQIIHFKGMIQKNPH